MHTSRIARIAAAAAFFAACIAHAQAATAPTATTTPAPKAPRHVTRAISTIAVKVVSAADFARGKVTKDAQPWRITAADTDSCVAWVSDKAPNVIDAELQAFKACRERIDRAVDGAVARDEARRTFPACTSEDASTGPSPCVWDCATIAVPNL